DDDEYLCRSRWNRYQDDEEDEAEEPEEEDDDEGARFTVVTVDDAWQYIDEWRNTDDGVVEFGPIPLADGELLPEGALDEEPPDKTRLMEASGNEGASYERSYRRVALILWRHERYAEVLLQAGVVAALPYLKQLAAGGKRARPEAVAVAERMVDAWPGDARGWDYSMDRAGPESADRIEMIAALTKLKAPPLLDRFLKEKVT